MGRQLTNHHIQIIRQSTANYITRISRFEIKRTSRADQANQPPQGHEPNHKWLGAAAKSSRRGRAEEGAWPAQQSQTCQQETRVCACYRLFGQTSGDALG